MNKEKIIELLEKNVTFWDNEGEGRIVQMPRDDYDQVLVLLREPVCKICNGSEKMSREETQHCKLRLCVDLKILSCFKCQYYIHEAPCPDCKEQPVEAKREINS